jgi:hypothetical protein
MLPNKKINKILKDKIKKKYISKKINKDLIVNDQIGKKIQK